MQKEDRDCHLLVPGHAPVLTELTREGLARLEDHTDHRRTHGRTGELNRLTRKLWFRHEHLESHLPQEVKTYVGRSCALWHMGHFSINVGLQTPL